MNTVKYVLLIVSSLIFVACDKKSSNDSKEMAEEENKDKFKKTDFKDDTEFVVAAADDGLMEVKVAELALSNASSAEVKRFAESMVSDHGKANSELKDLAEKKQISIPTTVSDKNQEKYDELLKKTGAEFDEAYTELMVADHKDAIDAFKKEADKGNDPDIKTWASSKVATLEHHLMMVQEAEKNLKASQ